MPKSAVKNTGSSSSLVDAGAGFVGATAMVLSTQPIDTLKVNYQCNTTKSPKSWSSILASSRRLTGRGGILALWTGTLPALYAYNTEHAVIFGCWGRLTKFFWPTLDNRDGTLNPLFLGRPKV